jgi:hypothetical protein
VIGFWGREQFHFAVMQDFGSQSPPLPCLLSLSPDLCPYRQMRGHLFEKQSMFSETRMPEVPVFDFGLSELDKLFYLFQNRGLNPGPRIY